MRQNGKNRKGYLSLYFFRAFSDKGQQGEEAGGSCLSFAHAGRFWMFPRESQAPAV